MSQSIGLKRSSGSVEWERWGQQNPYRGVLGVETEGISEEQKAKFFESGAKHIGATLELAERHFGAPNWQGRALDFGCGVGRLLLPLSQRFHSVVGVDISPSMLGVAGENLAGTDNVSLVCGLENVRAAVPDPDRGFDFVHTFIVMQHIRPKEGMEVLRTLLDLVAPGGHFAIHMTVGDQLRKRRILNQMRYHFRPAHWAYNLAHKRPLNEPKTEMSKYDSGAVFEMLRLRGCEPFLVHAIDHNRHVGMMLIGRKQPLP